MEFNFRAVDGRSSPPSPFFNNLPEPPFPSPMPGNSFPSMPHYSNNGRDLVLRDREREMMVREEIILGEIARRREIELEVRRDIMFLEREMAARRAGFSFDYGSGAMPTHIRWPSQPPPPHWGSSPGPMPMPMLPPLSFVGPEALALPPRDAASVLNPSPVANNDKLIVLDRPNPDVIGTKRKAVEPPPTLAANEPRLVGLKKKPKAEWSCAICQVTAPREKVLNAHLRGKKHKAKEERLKIQNLGNTNVSNHSDSNMKAKLERGLPTKSEAENVSNKYKIVPGNKSKDEVAGDLNNAAGSEAAQQESGTKEHKKKKRKIFTLWCEMCQIGSFSPQVMEDHKRGKKHRAKLLEHSKSDEAAKPNHISLELIVPKPAEDEASLITTLNSLKDIVSKPEVSDVTYEPNGMLFKAVVVPKLEAPELAYNIGKSDEAAPRNIVPKIEKQDVDGQEVQASGVNSEGKA